MDAHTNGASTIWPETDAGKRIQVRLSEDQTLDALDRLLQRIETLETAVTNLTVLMRQGPGLVAMAGDMVDEAYRKSDEAGVSIDARLKNALTIAEKLTAPRMVAQLDRLVSFTNQLPGLMAMQADIVDEAYRKADAQGVNIEERLGVALQLAEKMTQPQVAEKLDALLKVGDQLPGMMAMTVDMVDEGMRKAIANGFDPQTLADTASAANTALTKAKAEAPAKVGGIFGLLKLIKDPDRQKGLGFLMNFLKHFGRNI
ncbi:MAG: DUF1641 domain-containing protein [Saprospiraceae bacterium]|nr:DUF1641 domain-containing protein [Saprospiraceae bacterium]